MFVCVCVCMRLPESMQQVYENSLFMSSNIRLSVGVSVRMPECMCACWVNCLGLLILRSCQIYMLVASGANFQVTTEFRVCVCVLF